MTSVWNFKEVITLLLLPRYWLNYNQISNRDENLEESDTELNNTLFFLGMYVQSIPQLKDRKQNIMHTRKLV